jgi:long-chain acyl-CoA synthetase
MTQHQPSEYRLSPAHPRQWMGLEPAGAILGQAALAYAHLPALSFCGKATSYAELESKVAKTADLLRRFGAGPGVRVALLLPNCPAILTYVFAAFAVGASIVPLDPDGSPDEWAVAVRAKGVSILVACDLATIQAKALDLAQRTQIPTVTILSYAAMLPALAAARLRISGPKLARPPAISSAHVVLERTALREKGAEAVSRPGPIPRVSQLSDPAFHTWTTGQGVPREAVLTHESLARNLAQVCAALPAFRKGEERILAAMPWWHPLAFLFVCVGLIDGCEIVIPPQTTADRLAQEARRWPPTILMASPPFLEGLLAQTAQSGDPLSAARLIVTLGAPMPASLYATLATRTKAAVLESYALADPPLIVAMSSTGKTNAGSALQPLTGTRFSVRDFADHAREVPAGERGQLFVAGPQVTPAEGELPPRDGPAGFVRTGDLGLVDAQGRVARLDHLEDLIVAAGYLIYPHRIEAALAEHEGIAASAVIGIPDGRRGNAPKAFVVLKRGLSITERDVRLHLASRISKIEMPADIDFCAALPRDPFGSVSKAALRRQEAAKS